MTESSNPENSNGLPGLAPKLDHLFAVVPKPAGGRYSNETASDALAQAGVKVSAVHLSHLRTGRRNNPSARLLDALANLFGVKIGYFFDPEVEKQTNAELETLRGLSDAGVGGLMMRQGVSAENLRDLDAILTSIRNEIAVDRNRRGAGGAAENEGPDD